MDKNVRLEKSRIIDNFMGVETKVIGGVELWTFHDKDYFTPLYDLSLDWIEPVLDKIIDVYNELKNIEDDELHANFFYIHQCFKFSDKNRRINTFEAVVKFIDYYNKIK